nr:MAG TPA: hypothetical protein [Bacteriophage sp.]
MGPKIYRTFTAQGGEILCDFMKSYKSAKT